MAKRPTSRARPDLIEMRRRMLELLRAHYHESAWTFVHELSTSVGRMPAKYFDAWAMSLSQTSGFVRVSFELKISRADFERELHHPDKRREALGLSNYFFFIAPHGLIQRSELPAEAGLIEYKDGALHFTVQAPYRDGGSATWPFVAALLRRTTGMRPGRLKLGGA